MRVTGVWFTTMYLNIEVSSPVFLAHAPTWVRWKKTEAGMESFSNSSTTFVSKPEKTAGTPAQVETAHTRTWFATESESVTFIRRRGSYILVNRHILKNNLLPAVGYLELANAGDFPANVWNEIPVPIYAIVLMAIGGTVSLSMSYFAFKDAWLSWCNFRHLCEERRELQARMNERTYKSEKIIDIGLACQLDVNRREMGTEVFDRLVMDVLMGCGSIIVSIGTYLAIGGANRTIWFTSNLLSGYIGNSPAAIFGLTNVFWCAFVWFRAGRHGTAAVKELDVDVAKYQLKPRLRAIKIHALVTGVTGLVAGCASMVTATMWWGYVVLIPCIVSCIWGNCFWRRKLGYRRLLSQPSSRLTAEMLVDELRFLARARQEILEAPSPDIFKTLGIDTTSLHPMLEFMRKSNLFHDFSHHILHNRRLFTAVSNQFEHEMTTITSQKILETNSDLTEDLLEVARKCIKKSGPECLAYRERYLLEILGCYLEHDALCHEAIQK